MKKNNILIAFLSLFLLMTATAHAATIQLMSSVYGPFKVTIEVTKFPDRTSTLQVLTFTTADADAISGSSKAKSFTIPAGAPLLGVSYQVTSITFESQSGTSSAKAYSFFYNNTNYLPGVGITTGQAMTTSGSLHCELQLRQPSANTYEFLANCY